MTSFDSNGDGIISVDDAGFGDILVWTDTNQDGISQAGELTTLADNQIASTDLNARGVDYQIDGQDIFAQGRFNLESGATRDYVGVNFDQVAIESAEEADGYNSSIIGTDGDDVIVSTGGPNKHTGGDGSDTFVLTNLEAADLITDYNMDEGDVIDLSLLLESAEEGSGPDPSQVSYDSDTGTLSVDPDGSGAFKEVANLHSDGGDHPTNVTIIIDDTGNSNPDVI